MAILSQPVSNARASIGDILGRAFGVLGKRPVATFGATFLLSVLPVRLYAMTVKNLVDPMLPLAVTAVIVGLVTGQMAQAALVHATLAYARGERSSLGSGLQIGLRKFLPLLALYLIFVFGVSTGLVLLIVPGVLLAVMGSVAAPVLVAENVGILAAFRRSFELTKGHRWKIFALECMMLVLILLISLVSNIIHFMMDGMMARSVQWSAAFIYSIVFSTLLKTGWCAVQASLYVSLRNASQGPELESLAEVFA